METPGQESAPQNLIEIEQATKPTDEVRTLVEELEEELSANYPPKQRHGLKIEAIFQPHIRFFIARIDGSPVGCGGIALFNGFAEVKRMYVRQSSRGLGAADAIVKRLEEEALNAGLNTLKLETGTEQAAALRFYERCGFGLCEAFEPYSSMEPHTIATSVFMEKRL